VEKEHDKSMSSKVNEITFNSLFNFFWSKRIQVFKVSGFFVIVGVIIALTTPKEWSAYTQLLPESQYNTNKPSNNSLKNLAGLAGINLSNGEGTSLNPLLYSEIIESSEFSEAILNEEVYFSEINESLVLKKYITEYWKTPLTKKVIRLPFKALAGFISIFKSNEKKVVESIEPKKESSIISWSKVDEDFHKLIQSHTNLTDDEMNGLISISVSFQDPQASAHMVEFTKDYLVAYVSDYNTKKQIKNLEFLNTQIREADSIYKVKKVELAGYRDNNLRISTASGQVELDFLQYEVDLAFNLFSQLASKKQEVELLLQENMSVFTVLKPTIIPLENSKPNRIAIVFLSGMLGLILAAIWLFYNRFIKK
jgi:LPS O-antigen subunit length determinant protein (WzzB/FepE family)